MKRFREWALQKEAGEMQANNMAPGGETPLAHAVSPNPQGVMDDLQIKSIVKKRLQAFMNELEGYHLSKARAVELLSVVLQEFTNEFGLNRASMSTAMRQANQTNMPMQ